MPTLRRRVVAVSVAFVTMTAALGASPAAALSGTVIDNHDSFIPTRAFDISSSANGTLFGTDIGGNGKMYAVNGALTTSSNYVDLGPASFAPVPPRIRANRVVLPTAGASYDAPVTSVKTCLLGTCPTMSTVTAPAGTQYVGHGEDRGLFWNAATSTLTAREWTGSSPPSTNYAIPVPVTENLPAADGDLAGIVITVSGDVTYVNRSTGAVTLLNGYANEAYLTPTWIVWYAMGVGPTFEDTVVYRVLRSSPGAPPIATVLPGAPGIETFAATDAGFAYLSPNGDSEGTKALYTAAYDTTPTLFPRPVTTSGLSRFQNTNAFLFNDRLAAVPGLYRIEPGASSGALTGLVPTRPAITLGLSVSNGRAAYIDDMTPDAPMFIRPVSGATPGAETTVTGWTGGGAVGLSGDYVAFTREGTTSSTARVVYGPVGGPFTTKTFPVAEVGTVGISGRTVYVTSGSRGRLIDVITGAVTDLGNVYVGVFGPYAYTINYDTGAVARRNLLTGAVAAVRPAISGCTTDCIDEERPQISVWGNEVVYAFERRSGGVVAERWTPGAGIQPLPMLTTGGEPQWYELEYWDGLLLVSRVGGEIRLYDLRTGIDVTGIWVDSDAERPIGLDGHVIAWRPNSHLRAVVYRIGGDSVLMTGYTPEPRHVASDAPAGFGPGVGAGVWRPRAFVSQDVTWVLEVKSPTGEVVTSDEGRSVNGVVRPDAWDGTDANTGSPVPQGLYTWTLTGTSASGSPVPLKTADGTSTAITGTVYYSAAALGAPGIATPTRSTDLSATTAFLVDWTAPAGAPAGTTYTLERSVNGGAYATVLSGTTFTAHTYTAPSPGTYRFRVKAIDPAGRAGALSAVDTTMVPFDDRLGTISAGWASSSASSFYRGTQRKSSTAGATFSYSSTGTQIHLIGTKAASYGQIQVSIDGGAYSSAIDTYSSSTRYRQVLYTKTGLSNATHSIKVRVVGTSGRPSVGIDGVGFLR